MELVVRMRLEFVQSTPLSRDLVDFSCHVTVIFWRNEVVGDHEITRGLVLRVFWSPWLIVIRLILRDVGETTRDYGQCTPRPSLPDCRRSPGTKLESGLRQLQTGWLVQSLMAREGHRHDVHIYNIIGLCVHIPSGCFIGLHALFTGGQRCPVILQFVLLSSG